MPRFPPPKATIRSISLISGIMAASKTKVDQPFSVRSYMPPDPEGPFPYSTKDLTPMESGNDRNFYSVPRFVTHIDDNAINHLRRYYEETLPRKGRILDFCSSWVSHYPTEVEETARNGELEISGIGMNKSELNQNPVLKAWTIQDLNETPEVEIPGVATEARLDASTCVVSIDYLTKPVQVLQAVRRQTNEGGKVHLVISNRCFPTKVVSRWLKIAEEERLEMVGDYLWWSGWRDIEIVTVVQATWMRDPLWVVRGTNKSSNDSISR